MECSQMNSESIVHSAGQTVGEGIVEKRMRISAYRSFNAVELAPAHTYLWLYPSPW